MCWHCLTPMVIYQSCRWDRQQYIENWTVNNLERFEKLENNFKVLKRFELLLAEMRKDFQKLVFGESRTSSELVREMKIVLSGQFFIKNEPLKTVDLVHKSTSQIILVDQLLTWEFDPGSGWTLAACLTHASRTKHSIWFPSGLIILWLSGGRVSNAWVTYLIQGDNSWKRLLIPHKRTASHDAVWKAPTV